MPGADKCHLHIPFKDLSEFTEPDRMVAALEANFREIERWAERVCCEPCGGGDTDTGQVGIRDNTLVEANNIEVTVSKPATAPGDLMIVVLMTSAQVIWDGVPAGWGLVGTYVNTDAPRTTITVFSKVATGGEPGSYLFESDSGVSHRIWAWMVSIEGVTNIHTEAGAEGIASTSPVQIPSLVAPAGSWVMHAAMRNTDPGDATDTIEREVGNTDTVLIAMTPGATANNSAFIITGGVFAGGPTGIKEFALGGTLPDGWCGIGFSSAASV